MRRYRFWIVALVTFLLVTCGALMKKAIALSLCSILGFESFTCPVALLRDTRTLAATPPSTLIAQDIFGGDRTSPGSVDSGGGPPIPQRDIFPNNNTSPIPTDSSVSPPIPPSSNNRNVANQDCDAVRQNEPPQPPLSPEQREQQSALESRVCRFSGRYTVFANRGIFGGDHGTQDSWPAQENLQRTHEHIFFCENGQITENIGFGPIDDSFPGTFTGTRGHRFSYSDSEIQSGRNRDGRIDDFLPIDDRRYNSNLIHDALNHSCSLAEGNYQVTGYNCQEFAEDIRERYINNLCGSPPDRAERNGSQKSSASYGDPHMLTYDGYRYNFQTIGEYILTKSVDGMFEVQTRQSQLGTQQFSVNTGAAMKVGSDRVAFYITYFPDNATDTSLRVNGEPTYLGNGESLSLASGGTVQHQSGNDYLVEWPNGEYVSVKESSFSGIALLDITPNVYSNPPGQFVGLLGDLDGDPANDLRTRGGSVVPSRSTYGEVRQVVTSLVPIPGIVPLNQLENAVFDQIYRDFGDSWRVSSAESLFDYAPGEGPATFADPNFPSSYRSLENLTPEQMQEAEAVCLEAGVEPELMDGCVFDVAFTNETGFADAAANALLDEVRDRVIDEVERRLPVSIPGLPF